MNPIRITPSEFNLDRYAPGRYWISIELRAGTRDLDLNVLLIRGAETGKTLVVTGGVHGDECEGVRAILETFRELDPSEMRGTFLAVPVANAPAFWSGTRVSPLDSANLARVFPGSLNGLPTETIAYWIDQLVLSRADLYLDLHSGGIRFAMPTLVGYYEADPRARDAAFAFGAPVVWCHPLIAPGRTISAAVARGIPALYAESPGGGRISLADLALYRCGLKNLLHHLSILTGKPVPAPVWLHLRGNGDIDQGIQASVRGILISRVRLLEEVTRGQEIGVLVDIGGNVIECLHAPSSGRVVLIHAYPVVVPGEPLFLISA
jgi:predicted deacylase